MLLLPLEERARACPFLGGEEEYGLPGLWLPLGTDAAAEGAGEASWLMASIGIARTGGMVKKLNARVRQAVAIDRRACS